MSVIDSLPVEVIINIVLFLETQSILRVTRLVTRTFNAAATHDVAVWKTLCFRRFGAALPDGDVPRFQALAASGDWAPVKDSLPTPESLFATLGQWKAVFLQLPPPAPIFSYNKSVRNMKTADRNSHLRVTVTWDGHVHYPERKSGQWCGFDRQYRLSIAKHEDFLTKLRAVKNASERIEYLQREYQGGVCFCEFRVQIEGDDFADSSGFDGLLEFLKELAPEKKTYDWSV